MSHDCHDIVLCTLNARYMHSAFGLRYLLANLGEWQERAIIREFTIHQRPVDIAEELLALKPEIIGFGVYIWNVTPIQETVALLKTIAPQLKIVLGGPEVSHAPDLPPVANLADYIIQGPGETRFRQLCSQLLQGQQPLEHIIEGKTVPLDTLKLPYHLYNQEDINQRLIYVEASRGCPFKCEFCLSALDKTAKPFDQARFLNEMHKLLERGVRNFKFIDRTFNLNIRNSVSLLEFFLQHITDDLFLHFEVVPDHLPDKLKTVLKRFPPNTLQFEIGIQTFDPEIQTRISRKQDNQKTTENLRWLRQNTSAHIHADLIFGLPGDTLENFAESFNRLVALEPQEIQLGILKRLRGAPLNRHNEEWDMRYDPMPPYSVLSTRTIDFSTLQEMKRFARFWDMIANSGRFKATLPLILGIPDGEVNKTPCSAFQRFLTLSQGIYQREGRTWKISLPRLFKAVYAVLVEEFGHQQTLVFEVLDQDYRLTGQRGNLNSLLHDLQKNNNHTANKTNMTDKTALPRGQANKRQQVHQRLLK